MKYLTLILVWVLQFMLPSCSSTDENLTKFPDVIYKSELLNTPRDKIIVVNAKSNSGRKVVRNIESGMKLCFGSSTDYFKDGMYLDTLQNPDAEYEIVEDKWTTIIRICIRKEDVKNRIHAIEFSLDSGRGSETHSIKVNGTSLGSE